jgi:hypothetical protein
MKNRCNHNKDNCSGPFKWYICEPLTYMKKSKEQALDGTVPGGKTLLDIPRPSIEAEQGTCTNQIRIISGNGKKPKETENSREKKVGSTPPYTSPPLPKNLEK